MFHRIRATFLLATNMISVGIDVATSERDASGRDSRSSPASTYRHPAVSAVNIPGVAFAMYDGGKSRDRSHYEQFRPYHESFYRHVEPTGATPFSAPATEKGASCGPDCIYPTVGKRDWNSENDAVKFRVWTGMRNTVKDIVGYLVNRCIDVNRRINPHMKDDSADLKREMEDILEKWDDLARECGGRFSAMAESSW